MNDNDRDEQIALLTRRVDALNELVVVLFRNAVSVGDPNRDRMAGVIQAYLENPGLETREAAIALFDRLLD